MKKILVPAMILFALAAICSCNDEESDMAKMIQLEDSVFKYYPNTQAFHVKPEDRENLIVVVGDKSLYAAPDNVKQQEATDIGRIAVTLFGKDSYLKKGRLVVTQDIHNTSDEPADGITTPINVDSLRKALFPK